jgi:hypothetical protein
LQLVIKKKNITKKAIGLLGILFWLAKAIGIQRIPTAIGTKIINIPIVALPG